ncbi:MAG: hypothetical protein IJS32_01735 [Kiritimatiellae bacterium]|nr:hypothetical protein [Kiritimatiellia bacterium]
MKKIIAIALIVSFVCAAVVPNAFAAKSREPGGLVAGLVGCCFGIRTAAAYNSGKELHIRDILQLLFVGSIWSFFSAYGGITSEDLHESDPAYF